MGKLCIPLKLFFRRSYHKFIGDRRFKSLCLLTYRNRLRCTLVKNAFTPPGLSIPGLRVMPRDGKNWKPLRLMKEKFSTKFRVSLSPAAARSFTSIWFVFRWKIFWNYTFVFSLRGRRLAFHFTPANLNRARSVWESGRACSRLELQTGIFRTVIYRKTVKN